MPLLPSTAGARRYRFDDIRDTQNRQATSDRWRPVSIRSAAASRTARGGPSRGGQPLLSRYLMVPA